MWIRGGGRRPGRGKEMCKGVTAAAQAWCEGGSDQDDGGGGGEAPDAGCVWRLEATRLATMRGVCVAGIV